MSFNYFPDLNRYFQSLYTRNQEWFRHRHHLTPAEQQRLFQAFLRMEEGLPVTIAGMRSNIRIPVFLCRVTNQKDERAVPRLRQRASHPLAPPFHRPPDAVRYHPPGQSDPSSPHCFLMVAHGQGSNRHVHTDIALAP